MKTNAVVINDFKYNDILIKKGTRVNLINDDYNKKYKCEDLYKKKEIAIINNIEIYSDFYYIDNNNFYDFNNLIMTDIKLKKYRLLKIKDIMFKIDNNYEFKQKVNKMTIYQIEQEIEYRLNDKMMDFFDKFEIELKILKNKLLKLKLKKLNV